ncbi:MAG: hypothetical protein ACXADH_14610, partial [Candidatus Kariarchaeaceae archaeon]
MNRLSCLLLLLFLLIPFTIKGPHSGHENEIYIISGEEKLIWIQNPELIDFQVLSSINIIDTLEVLGGVLAWMPAAVFHSHSYIGEDITNSYLKFDMSKEESYL